MKGDKLRAELHMLGRIFKLYHRFTGGFWFVVIFHAMLQSASPFINLYFSARILNELIGNKNVRLLGRYVLLTLSINLAVYLLMQGIEKLKNIAAEKIMWKEYSSVSEVYLKTDYENLGDPSYQNKKRYYLERIQMEGGLCWRVIENVQSIVKGAITIGTAIVFAVPAFMPFNGTPSFFATRTASFLMIFLLVGASIYSVWLNGRQVDLDRKFMEEFMLGNRSFVYYAGDCMEYRYGKEIRLYSEGRMLVDGMKKVLDIDRLGKRGLLSGYYEAVKEGLGVLLGGCVYFFIGAKAIAGAFGAGMIVQYVGAVTQFTGGFSDIISGISALRSDEPFLENYLGILDSKPIKYQGTLPVEKRDDNEYEIEFRNVSFRYPGSDNWALRNLSLKMKVGGHLAVVGKNGSGKTTFIKLLCRLYDPVEGEILLNGIDIRKYDYEEYLSLFSVVFQDFRLFSFSLGQNVAASVEVDGQKAEDCLNKTGFSGRMPEMPRGLDTPLYRDFESDGVEISGGEAQKIALARALYKDAPFVILDEPTAALDPVAEYEIYSGFEALVGSKSAVYISHRLSSCRFCDDIAVFEQGRMVQRGDHETLLAQRGGLYQELWNAQAQYYEDNAEESEIYSIDPVMEC